MVPDAITLTLEDEDATRRLGQRMAGVLAPGDSVLLSGGIGAGKTSLARAIIRALTRPDEDVPSPTFTLVQTYATPIGEVWHADLYRLSGPGDVGETGLADALGNAICLIEWPDRLGFLAPDDALTVDLALSGEGRLARLSASGKSWAARMPRLEEP